MPQPDGAIASWRLATPASRVGAIALLQIRGDVEGAFRRLGLLPVPVGGVALREFGEVDTGLVARVRDDLALLTPHGGREILVRLAEWLGQAGIPRDSGGAGAAYPEGRSELEARLMETLSRAASPLAVDLLLDQPRRWLQWGIPDPAPGTPAPDPSHSRMLGRLVDPPLVVALGASNIGKSTLLNRLAGRPVAAVADEPGTTLDHVGALVNLEGLAVRYIDAPGIRAGAGPGEREAGEIVRALLPGADLVLLLGDARTEPPSVPGAPGALRVGLRADLGRPGWEADAVVSALTGEGLPALVAMLREALVPRRVLDSPLPWRFWQGP